MHLAAQGNQAYSLAYFKSKYLDINERDNSDSTPLHWAMINLSANAIDYLLAWGCEINIQDHSGLAPLHLAVMTAPKVGDTVYIKRLILRGADRQLKDRQNFGPLEIANKIAKDPK